MLAPSLVPAFCSKLPKAGATSRFATPWTSAAIPPFVCERCTWKEDWRPCCTTSGSSAIALTGGQAAHLIAIACSPVPTGHDHWTVRLLAGKAVELGFVESISPETIRQLLKKTNSSPGNTSHGVSQP